MTVSLSIVPDATPPVPLPPGMILPPLRPKWTAQGECVFRECPVPIYSDTAMHVLWKANRLAFLQRGYSVRSHNGKWILSQWLRKDGSVFTLTVIGQEKVNALTCPDELPMEAEEEVLADLPELPAHLAAKLFDYQVTPARQLLRALTVGKAEWGYPGAWDCSDLGTGKTYQALAAAIATGLEVGVICPLSVIPSWQKAFRHFGQCARFIRNYESLRTGRRDYVRIEKYIGGTGKQMRRFQWELKPEDTILLFDEAHNCKNAGTLNQGLAMAAIRQQFPLIFISGTLASDPTHMRATGRAVGLHSGDQSYVQFLDANGCVGESKSGKDWAFMGGMRGRRILLNLHRMVFPKRGARVRIADLGDRFPETQIMAEAFETGETKAIAEAFKEAQRTIDQLEANGTKSEGEIKMLKGSAYMKAWHESERLKVPTLCEMVHDEQEEGRSVVVFVNFTDVREALMHRLKTGCAIFGGQPASHRQRCIEDFQAGRSREIIANIDAGGVGVSLHDETGDYPRTSIVLPTNKVVSLTQALGRVHRAGGKSRSRQIIMFAAGTLEETICDNVRRKMAQITTLNDGDLNPEARF